MPWDEMHAHTPGELAGLAKAPRDRAVIDSTTAEQIEPRGELAHAAMLQRDAARALHVPVPGVFPPECRTCLLFHIDTDVVAAAWPCETAQALGANERSPYVAPWGP